MAGPERRGRGPARAVRKPEKRAPSARGGREQNLPAQPEASAPVRADGTGAGLTHLQVVLELSDARFGELVDGVRRATREEIFKGTGIHKATRRILDPVRRRQTAAQRLHTWLEEDPGGGEDVAFRLLYDVLSGLLRPLVVDFLDACEIPHEDGMTDGLTRLNDAEASDLVGTVADLAEKHPHGDLALYLYFTAADPDFDALATTLEKVDGLRAALGS